MTYIPKLCNTCRKVVLEESVHFSGKLLEDKQFVLARECRPVVAPRYGLTSRLLVLPYLEAHTTGPDGLLQLPYIVALCTMVFLQAMVLAISIKNKVPYEDIHDAEEEMKLIEHNVVEGDIQQRREHTTQVTRARRVGVRRQLLNSLQGTGLLRRICVHFLIDRHVPPRYKERSKVSESTIH